MKKSLCLVCTLFAALLLIGHPVWGQVTSPSSNPLLVLDDNDTGEANWVVEVDHSGSPDQSFVVRWIAAEPGFGTPFTIEKGAADNLLYLDASEFIGINTSNPLVELDINSASPEIRLDDTDGFSTHVDLQMSGVTFAIEGSSDQDIVKVNTLAPANSLDIDSEGFVEIGTTLNIDPDEGYVGIGTTTPDAHLEVRDTLPRIRLQDTTAGGKRGGLIMFVDTLSVQGNTDQHILTAHTEAPANSLNIDSAGKVGIGTATPGFPMELEKTATNASFVIDRTDGATNYINATASYGNFGTVTAHPLRLVAGGLWKLKVNTDGTLDMSDGGSYNGSWNDASSRDYKENIESLSAEEALEAFQDLSPVKYNYKMHKEEERVGFIAEEVPDLVGMEGRKNLSSMDVVAVLTKVVQEQQKAMQKQEETIAKLQERLADIERMSQ